MQRGCLNLLPHIDQAMGGLATSVPPLSRCTSTAGGFPSRVAAFCKPDEELDAHSAEVERLVGGAAQPGMWRKLSGLVDACELMHIHGLWAAPTFCGGWLARRKKIPYMISAHGMLEPWALNHKRLKKRVYAAVTERSTLARAACLRALTYAEAEDYRRFGLRNPIAIVPNGVDIHEAPPDFFLGAFPQLSGLRLVLYLGRIHSKKGPDILLRAWQSIASQHTDAHLVFAGQDEAGTQARLEDMAKEAGIQDRVTFTGVLRGELKWSALAASSLFVLPSHSEGFSVATLEAMGSGLPVIISPNCHFPEVAERQCGWIVEPVCQALTGALDSVLKAPLYDFEAMGTKARQLVRERYQWDAIGGQMAEVYRWILGGPKPRQTEVIH